MMRMDRAVVLWERLLLKDPGDTEIRRKLIAQYRFDGDTDNIVALLERSIETVGKREPFLYYDLLDAYEALGDEDKAYALLAKMSNVFPADVSVIAGRAYLAMKKGLYREARGQFALLKEKDPLSLEWYTEDVRAAYMLDDIPSAWAVFDDALRRFGSQQRLFDMRDMLLARAKDEDELLERLAYCAKAAPDDGVLWKRIGFIRLKRREQQAALDAFKRYNQLTGGDHETYAAVGDLYAVLGNQQQSRDAYADALRLLRERQRR
jgi:tetratricopeptide (TPR) repeat protein